MKKRETQARLLVRQAKNRLVNNDYANVDKERDSGTVYLNNRPVPYDQYVRIEKTVEQIMASDTLVYDALDRLIVDRGEFESLDQTDRVRYMFELSKIYSRIRSDKKKEER